MLNEQTTALLRLALGFGHGDRGTVRDRVFDAVRAGCSCEDVRASVKESHTDMGYRDEELFAYAMGIVDGLVGGASSDSRPTPRVTQTRATPTTRAPKGRPGRSYLTADYLARRERLRGEFDAAFDFLTALEEGEAGDTWLSTSINAHLYKGRRFLSYIRVTHLSASVPHLSLSRKYNVQIVEGTEDANELLFPSAIRQVAKRTGGLDGPWIRESSGGVFHLTPAAPKSFFEALLGIIQTI